MREHHITVPRTARYFTLGDAATASRLWIVCHGYAQLAGRFIRRFEILDDGRHLIVAPEGLSRFYLDAGSGPHGREARIGASWMTREDRLGEISDYIGYLDGLHAQVHESMSRRDIPLVVLGFSQGVATVCRWLVRSEVGPRRLLLWGASLPPDLDLAAFRERLAHTRVTLVCGEEDPFATSGRLTAEQERLTQNRIPFELVTCAGGHRIDQQVLARLDSA